MTCIIQYVVPCEPLMPFQCSLNPLAIFGIRMAMQPARLQFYLNVPLRPFLLPHVTCSLGFGAVCFLMAHHVSTMPDSELVDPGHGRSVWLRAALVCSTVAQGRGRCSCQASQTRRPPHVQDFCS
jgi:hypothetical protein